MTMVRDHLAALAAEALAVVRENWALTCVGLMGLAFWSFLSFFDEPARKPKPPQPKGPTLVQLIFDLILLGKWVNDHKAEVAPLIDEAKAVIAEFEQAKAAAAAKTPAA